MSTPEKQERIVEHLTVPAHVYEIERHESSRLVPGAAVRLESHYRCPRCKNRIGELPHGQERYCDDCGLYVVRHGNGLTVSNQSAPRSYRDPTALTGVLA